MKQDIFPTWRGEMEYVCLGCGKTWPADQLVYACPSCNGVLLLRDKMFPFLKLVTGEEWRLVLDGRVGTRINALRGIFRFYEFWHCGKSDPAQTPAFSRTKRAGRGGLPAP